MVHRNSIHNRKLGPRWNVPGLAKSDASSALVVEESRLRHGSGILIADTWFRSMSIHAKINESKVDTVHLHSEESITNGSAVGSRCKISIRKERSWLFLCLRLISACANACARNREHGARLELFAFAARLTHVQAKFCFMTWPEVLVTVGTIANSWWFGLSVDMLGQESSGDLHPSSSPWRRRPSRLTLNSSYHRTVAINDLGSVGSVRPARLLIKIVLPDRITTFCWLSARVPRFNPDAA